MQRPPGTDRFVTLIALSLIAGGALAAGQSIVFDPDADPVADFPGNVHISGGDLDMRQNNLGGVSTLGVNGTFELDNADADVIRITQAIGDKQHTIRFDGNNLRFWSGDGAGTMLRLFNESGDVGLGGNTLTNVGGTDCAADEALLGDGSCGSTTVSDDWVNETGDTMSGTLNMGNNDIDNVQDMALGTAISQAGLQVDRSEATSAPGEGVFASGGSTGNPNIELRGNFSTPYIDFANNTVNDYDGRIRWHDGVLDIEGTTLQISGGDLNMAGNLIDGISSLQDQSGNALMTFDDANNEVDMSGSSGVILPSGDLY